MKITKTNKNKKINPINNKGNMRMIAEMEEILAIPGSPFELERISNRNKKPKIKIPLMKGNHMK